MATHDSAAVDRMRRRVVEMVGGKVVRDEEQGGHESAAPVSVISGNLPDDSAHREEHPLDDEQLVADWDGAPEPAGPAAGEDTAAGPEESPTGRQAASAEEPAPHPDPAEPAPRDVLQEELIDEREALRAREADDFGDPFSDDVDLDGEGRR